MLTRRRTDLCCLQEVRRKNSGTAILVGKRPRYKFFWNGNEEGLGGVGVMLAEKWWENVFAVDRVSNRILLVKMNIDKVVFAFVCVYAPQINLKAVEKDRFYDALQTVVTKVPGSEQLFICGDMNGHIGADSKGCSGCSLWVHKRCSGLPGALKEDPKYRCPRCQGTARRIDGRPIIELQLGKDKLEVVPEFCYLGDMTSACGGCDLAVIMRCKCAWGKFRQLLSLLTNRHIPLVVRGYVYSASVRSVMLYGAETWATTADTMSPLRRNDRAMLRWMCNVKLNDKVSSGSILSKRGLQDIETILRTNRLRWFGHVERSAGWINHVRNLEVQSQQKRPGRPKLTWNDG